MSLIYTYYYQERATADIYKYFDDSKIMYDALFSKPADFFKMLFGYANDSSYFDQYYRAMNNWYRVYESNLYNESHTIIRLNAFFRIFSFGYYNVHTVFICFLSFTGLVALYKTAINNISGKNKALIAGIFLLPSVVFWGSGVLKEGLLFFGIGLMVYFFFKLLKRFSFIALAWMLFSMGLIFYTKVYILAIAIPVLAGHLWSSVSDKRFTLVKYITVFILYFALGFNLHYIFPNLNVLEMLTMKQHDFIGLAQEMKSGSYIQIPLIDHSFSNLLLYSPLAFLNTYFRPFVFEANSVLVLMAAIENLVILGITLFAFLFIDKTKLNHSIFYACLFSVIFMFVLTGLITPVMGAMVRYKIPALPFLMIMLIYIIDNQKLVKKFPYINKYL